MARATKTDPATKKPLPKGVAYRGEGQYLARKMIQGQSESQTFASAAAAEAWLADIASDVRRDQFVSVAESRKWTFAQVVRHWRDEILKTRPQEKARLGDGPIDEVCNDPLGQVSMNALTKIHINRYLRRLMGLGRETDKDGAPLPDQKPLSGHTIIARRDMVLDAIRFCMREMFELARDPTQGVMTIEQPAARQRGFDSEAEETAVMAAAEADPWPYMALLVRLVLATGARLGELVSVDIAKDVKWDTIDGERRPTLVIWGVTRKGSKRSKKSRDVPILAPFIPLFMEVLAITRPAGDTRLFPVAMRKETRQRGERDIAYRNRRNAHTLSSRFSRIMDKAVIENFHEHDLRHIACGRLARFFPNPLDLAKMVGHKNMQMLIDVYYNIDSGAELHSRAVPELADGETWSQRLTRLRLVHSAPPVPPGRGGSVPGASGVAA